jgi:6-phosphogluconolactonase (cycloisomerase 2 family)
MEAVPMIHRKAAASSRVARHPTAERAGRAMAAPDLAPRASAMALTVALSAALAAGHPAPAAAADGLTVIDIDKQGVDGVDGVGRAADLVVSPDGRHVYVFSDPSNDEALAIFRRDLANGTLTFQQVRRQTQIPRFVLPDTQPSLVFSPDGIHLYATARSENRVYRYVRNPTAGTISYGGYVQNKQSGVNGLERPSDLAVSPDGRHLYVVSNGSAQEVGALAVFARQSDGTLTYVGRYIDGVNGNDGLDQPFGVNLSPDGEQVYVTSEGDRSVSVWDRNRNTGHLTFRQIVTNGAGIDTLDTADAVLVSPDGRHVYVGGYEELEVTIFSRSATGLLDYVGKRSVFGQISDLLVDPKGDQLYVGSSGAAAFHRDPLSGLLGYRDRAIENLDGVTWLAGANGMDLSPDGRHLYFASTFRDQVVSYDTGRSTAALLQDSRFAVSATFDSPSADGEARPVVLTPDTAYFWFFQDTNVELVVKVLDGCGTNNRYWVFLAGLTNVEVELTVTDTETGATRTYTSPQGATFTPELDTQAFATCP